MTSSSKSVLRCGPETLDVPDATPRAHSSFFDHLNNTLMSPATAGINQSGHPLGTVADEPVDHVVNSLSKALHTVELEHDRRCALDVDCRFALAGWNPRASAVAGDLVLARPLDLFDHRD